MANVEFSNNRIREVTAKEMKNGQVGVITSSEGTSGNFTGRVVMKIHDDMLVLLDNGDFWRYASEMRIKIHIFDKNEPVVLTN